MPEHSRELVAQHHLTFPVLQDSHNELARKFGLVFRLPDELRQVYLQFGNDLSKYNGDDSWELPMPGAFVIGSNHLIAHAAVDPDYTNRPEPEELVAAIRKLAHKAA